MRDRARLNNHAPTRYDPLSHNCEKRSTERIFKIVLPPRAPRSRTEHEDSLKRRQSRGTRLEYGGGCLPGSCAIENSLHIACVFDCMIDIRDLLTIGMKGEWYSVRVGTHKLCTGGGAANPTPNCGRKESSLSPKSLRYEEAHTWGHWDHAWLIKQIFIQHSYAQCCKCRKHISVEQRLWDHRQVVAIQIPTAIEARR